MTTVIYPEQKAHVISCDAKAIAIAKKLPDEFVKGDSERHQQRRLPYEKVKKFSASGLWGITVAKEYGGAFVSNATLTKVGLTQKTSQTLIFPCRASCFSQGETLRVACFPGGVQVGEPQGCTGFSVSGVVACGKPLLYERLRQCVYVLP